MFNSACYSPLASTQTRVLVRTSVCGVFWACSHISPLVTETAMVSEMLVSFHCLTWLISQEGSIELVATKDPDCALLI